jgi:hypothetical protein
MNTERLSFLLERVYNEILFYPISIAVTRNGSTSDIKGVIKILEDFEPEQVNEFTSSLEETLKYISKLKLSGIRLMIKLRINKKDTGYNITTVLYGVDVPNELKRETVINFGKINRGNVQIANSVLKEEQPFTINIKAYDVKNLSFSIQADSVILYMLRHMEKQSTYSLGIPGYIFIHGYTPLNSSASLYQNSSKNDRTEIIYDNSQLNSIIDIVDSRISARLKGEGKVPSDTWESLAELNQFESHRVFNELEKLRLLLILKITGDSEATAYNIGNDTQHTIMALENIGYRVNNADSYRIIKKVGSDKKISDIYEIESLLRENLRILQKDEFKMEYNSNKGRATITYSETYEKLIHKLAVKTEKFLNYLSNDVLKMNDIPSELKIYKSEWDK